MLKTLYAFLIALLLVLPANAQGVSSSMGWNTGNNSNIGIDEQVLTPVARPNLPQSRYLDVDSGLTKTDYGSGSSFVIGLGPVLTYFLNTGATSQQSAVNAILQFSGVAAGDLVYNNGANWVRLPKGANGTFLGIDGSGNLNYGSPSGSGTVTSVGQTVPSWLSISGSPVTGSGTLAIANGTGLSNYYVVATNGSGALDLRALSASHIPDLDVAKITTGVFAKARQHASTVYNDAANAYSTGTQDMSATGVAFKLPTDSPSAAGMISYVSNKIKWHNGTTVKTAADEATNLTAGTGLTGGGDLSANRSFALSTPVAPTNGGTGIASCITGDIIVATGANTWGALNKGANGTFLGVSGGVVGYYTPNTGIPLGGNGTRQCPTSGSISGVYYHHGDLTTTGAWTIADGTRIYCDATITIDHAPTLTRPNNGSRASTVSYSAVSLASGPGAGNPPLGYLSRASGGGGAFGGDGGNGGSPQSGSFGYGGKAYDIRQCFMSSGGSSAHGENSSYPPGAGGNGGNCCYLEAAVSIVFNANWDASGQAGGVGTSTYGVGGAGGSGGGLIGVAGTSITVNSGKTLSVAGGNGGNAGSSSAGPGPGGGGGWCILHAPTVTNNGTITTTAGSAAGTGATTQATTAAGAGQSVIIQDGAVRYF